MKSKVIFVMLVFGLGWPALALVPQIVYRGTLRSSSGTDKDYKMKFSLYDDRTKGQPLWTATIPKVRTDKNGVFQVALEDWRDDYVYPPDQTNITLNTFATLAMVIRKTTETKPIYIGLTVDESKEISPRLRYHPAALAKHASTAYSLAKDGSVREAVTVDKAKVSQKLMAAKVTATEFLQDGTNGTLKMSFDSPTTTQVNLDLNDGTAFKTDSESWTTNRSSDWEADYAIALVTTLNTAKDNDGDTPSSAWLAPACISPVNAYDNADPRRTSLYKAIASQKVPYSIIYRWMEGVKR